MFDFDSLVDRSGGAGACWPWLGVRVRSGHGIFKRRGSTVLAHRESFIRAGGVIPLGLNVLHNCPEGDNPACCNPAHLYVGTQADNMADMVRKGRHKPARPGQENPSAKLSDEQAEELRRAHATGLYSFRALGRMFQISHEQARRIVHRMKRAKS